jgi:hypothetical protein
VQAQVAAGRADTSDGEQIDVDIGSAQRGQALDGPRRGIAFEVPVGDGKETQHASMDKR